MLGSADARLFGGFLKRLSHVFCAEDAGGLSTGKDDKRKRCKADPKCTNPPSCQQPLNIAVLVSGGGTNLQALIDYKKHGGIKNGRISLVVSSKPDVYAIKRAEDNGIPVKVLNKREYTSSELFDNAVQNTMQEHNIDLIVLAGFLHVFGEGFTRKYQNKILNVHPSLIPSFCGKGFYGLKVHKSAIEYGVKLTGATVHFVNEVCDGGKIILQKAVEVFDGDTPEILQKRVMEQAEQVILPRAVEMVCDEVMDFKGELH